MEAANNRRWLVALTVLVVVCFVALACRLIHLQWFQHEDLAVKAKGQHRRAYFREAPRGEIRDRRGNILAMSVPVRTVCADPSLLKGQGPAVARVLAPLLQTNEAFLVSMFSRQTRVNRKGETVANQYVLLKRKVSVDDWEKIQVTLAEQFTNSVAGLNLKRRTFLDLQAAWTKSIYTEEDQIRVYPNGQLASHVVGFTGAASLVENGETNSFVAGVEGIERTFDDKVRGSRGWVLTETDNRQRELFIFREQDVESSPGLNVILTLDSRVQQIVEEELAAVMAKHTPESASAIVVRPRTGEILAMATLPTFDPNRPGRYPGENRRNRAITDMQEPGSTAKTITLAGALNDGTVRLTDSFDCENGYFHFAGYPLRDHLHYGILSVGEIIAKSSNIGTAKVAIKMGKERVHRYFTDFGFGKRTGILLTGEAPGYLPKLEDWKLIHVSRIPIGQGVSATPLQTAMALSAVANGGVLMQPMIVDRLVDENGSNVVKYQPVALRRVMSEAAAKSANTALRSVVEEKGTAEKAILEHYTVAGKTGTAQKVVNGQYSHEKYFASFIGYFPATDPELCILVCVDEPTKKSGYYGGQCAAPAFKRISERVANFLNIKPDLFPDGTNSVEFAEPLSTQLAPSQFGRRR